MSALKIESRGTQYEAGSMVAGDEDDEIFTNL